MWLLLAFLFINHASCCQGQHLVERDKIKYEVELLLKYIKDKCEERPKKTHINRNRALQTILVIQQKQEVPDQLTIRVVQQKQVVLDQLKTEHKTWPEKSIDNRLKALLKGIVGALIEAQSDYNRYLIMMNEWMKLHLFFHKSKDTLKDTNQRIIAFGSLRPKLYKFFNDDQSISAKMLSGFLSTYDDYVRNSSKQPNRKIEIQNRIKLYIFLLNQQWLSEKEFWETSTFDEIMQPFKNLLDRPLF